MPKREIVTGWKLPQEERAALLERFPPRYDQIVADHVTLRAGASEDTPAPRKVDAKVVGRADDGQSLECLVVALDGTTDRPDGSTYHITWSLGPGREAVESNDVLRELGWQKVDEVPIDLRPAVF